MAGKILATVGTLTVTEDELNEFIYSLGSRGAAYNSPEGRKAVLNQLINNKLLLLDARRNLYEAEEGFKAQLNSLKENLLVSYAAEKAIAGITVTLQEAKDYFEANKAQFMQPETVNASHILVDSESLANEILEMINGGKSFEECAKEYSSCPSKQNGGNLGDFERGQMVPEFDSAVFSMNVGEITKVPVKTQFGYHLIRLNSKNEAKEAPFESAKDRITEMLLNEKRRKAYESKINQLKILYPVDKTTL